MRNDEVDTLFLLFYGSAVKNVFAIKYILLPLWLTLIAADIIIMILAYNRYKEVLDVLACSKVVNLVASIGFGLYFTFADNRGPVLVIAIFLTGMITVTIGWINYWILKEIRKIKKFHIQQLKFKNLNVATLDEDVSQISFTHSNSNV